MIPVSGSRLGLEDIEVFQWRQNVAEAASVRAVRISALAKVSGMKRVRGKAFSDAGSVGHGLSHGGDTVILAFVPNPPIQKIPHNGSYFAGRMGFQVASSRFSAV